MHDKPYRGEPVSLDALCQVDTKQGGLQARISALDPCMKGNRSEELLA